MSTANGIPTADELQRHARWIRRLAGALLRDQGAAEDLVQDAWLAALSHPPAAGRLRPWLREVARNLARMRLRGEARRAAREREALPPAPPEGPDAFIERLETEQRLSRELAALDEPLRSVLMLRFYEDLQPAEIAARLRLPGGTVRWRLMRGLEVLRERLERAHGGDRRASLLALVPLARLDGAAGLAAATTAVVLPGVVLMNVLKLSVAAVAVLVLALGLSLSGVLPDALTLARREKPLAVGFQPLTLEPGPAPSEATLAPSATEPERSALRAGNPAAPAAEAAPGSATVDARFFARGRALSDAQLVVVHAGERVQALSSGPEGLASCTFPLTEPRALVNIELSAFGYASEAREAVCAQGGTTHLGRVELVPGGAVSGRVLDERGVGLAGVRLTLGSLDEPYPQLEALRLRPPTGTVPVCTSDASGRFRLLGVAAGMTRLWGHAPGRLADYSPPFEVRAGQESTGVELALAPLAPANLLRGIVLDPSGAPVPGASIEYRHAMDGGNMVRSGEARADQDGRFEFLLPEDAHSWLRARDPDLRWAPGSLADVTNSALELVLQLREAREFELVVEGRGRTPLEDFAVELLGVDASADLADLAEDLGPEQAAELVAEYAPRLGGLARARHAGGRARIALPDEPFLLRVLASGHRVLQLGPLEPERVGASLTCTLEEVAGLHGLVLRGGEPVGGVSVELRAEVGADTRVEVNGYRVRIHPDLHDQAVSDAQGRFVLTPRLPGRYFVRAEPATGAPAELGPVEVDGTLGGAPLELHLGRGGAIEGRVRLAGGADPEGAIVGITRGDCAVQTRRVGADGAFRFEALLPGPWRVELRRAEVFGPIREVSSSRGSAVEPFELGPTCTVYEGETTFVDVSDAAPESFAFEGRLTIDERAAVGWTASLGPVGSLEFEGDQWTPLDSAGRFQLRVPAPGEYRLALRQQGGEFMEQYLFEDLVLRGSEAPWERAFHTGTLLVSGLGAWDGEGPPPVVHYWKGSGQLFGLTVAVGSEQRALSVPAGRGELRAPGRSMDPESWKVLRELSVPRGAELRVELRPAELER